MKTQPLFVIPDPPPENRKPEPIEEKAKIRRELPEKDQPENKPEKPAEDSDEKKNKALPPDPFGIKGNKIDKSA